MASTCPLCSSSNSNYIDYNHRKFCHCSTCKGFYLDKNQLLNQKEEVDRYKLHKNHIKDQGYLNFVNPITSSVKKYFKPVHRGLDFGSGNIPVLSKKLKEENYQIDIYDPLFANNPDLLNNKYDFITCCEVIEHFYHPKNEFELLYNLLKPNGKLFCMTLIFHEEINFESWFYKNDPTHVFIYQKETMLWIKNNFMFQNVEIKGRLITFTK